LNALSQNRNAGLESAIPARERKQFFQITSWVRHCPLALVKLLGEGRWRQMRTRSFRERGTMKPRVHSCSEALSNSWAKR
jgi:hypothetical protein